MRFGVRSWDRCPGDELFKAILNGILQPKPREFRRPDPRNLALWSTAARISVLKFRVEGQVPGLGFRVGGSGGP